MAIPAERTLNPQQVADWFLAQVDPSAGDSISHLKLQKLLYYAQAWSLVLLDQPLFAENFQAWVHGPVLPSVYRKYRGSSYEPLPAPAPADVPRFAPGIETLLEDVFRLYGAHTATALENQTHRETPWIAARGDRPRTAHCTAVISRASMKEFFETMLLTHGGPVIAPAQQGFRIGGAPFLGPDARPLPAPEGDGFPPEDHAEFDRVLREGLASVGRKRALRRAARTG